MLTFDPLTQTCRGKRFCQTDFPSPVSIDESMSTDIWTLLEIKTGSGLKEPLEVCNQDYIQTAVSKFDLEKIITNQVQNFALMWFCSVQGLYFDSYW